MSALLAIQRAMQRSVLAHDADLAANEIAETGGASARERLDVYLHAYGARLGEVLRNDFSGLLVLVGDEAFDELARAYIETHPSHEFNVRWYGADFAQFLATTAPWSETPSIGEMARLDWAVGLCFDAADETCVHPQDLQALAPEDWPAIRFDLRRCVQRLRFEWNVGEIRRAADRGDPLPACVRLPAAQSWIVSRVGTKTFHRGVPDDEAAALDAIAAGATFADVCERLCEWHDADAVAPRAVSLLGSWVGAGWLAPFTERDR